MHKKKVCKWQTFWDLDSVFFLYTSSGNHFFLFILIHVKEKLNIKELVVTNEDNNNSNNKNNNYNSNNTKTNGIQNEYNVVEEVKIEVEVCVFSLIFKMKLENCLLSWMSFL